MKWINSGDAILVKSANKEFAGLLKEGATYIDYLKNQREIILQVGVANRTKAQNKQLRQLNDAIAEETKKTVLEAFKDRKSTRLNSSHANISYAVFCLKKKNNTALSALSLHEATSFHATIISSIIYTTTVSIIVLANTFLSVSRSRTLYPTFAVALTVA